MYTWILSVIIDCAYNVWQKKSRANDVAEILQKKKKIIKNEYRAPIKNVYIHDMTVCDSNWCIVEFQLFIDFRR